MTLPQVGRRRYSLVVGTSTYVIIHLYTRQYYDVKFRLIQWQSVTSESKLIIVHCIRFLRITCT